jgi:hypothetical protein
LFFPFVVLGFSRRIPDRHKHRPRSSPVTSLPIHHSWWCTSISSAVDAPTQNYTVDESWRWQPSGIWRCVVSKSRPTFQRCSNDEAKRAMSQKAVMARVTCGYMMEERPAARSLLTQASGVCNDRRCCNTVLKLLIFVSVYEPGSSVSVWLRTGPGDLGSILGRGKRIFL